MYPPGAVEEMRSKGLRFEGDPTGQTATNPWEAAVAPHGGFWRAGIDDEATSLFSPSQMEEISKVGLRPAGVGQLSRVGSPAAARSGPVPFAPRPAPASRTTLPPMPAPTPRPPPTFEEEATAMFMGGEEANEAGAREARQDRLVRIGSPAPRALGPAPKAGVQVRLARPAQAEEPKVGPPGGAAAPVAASQPPLAAVSPAAEAGNPASAAAARSDGGFGRGASLEQIQRLHVSVAYRKESPFARMPRWLPWTLLAMTAGGLTLLLMGLIKVLAR